MSEVLELCVDLVRAGGVGRDVGQVTECMRAYLTSKGFSTEIIDCAGENGAHMPALYATIGSGDKHLLFNGHLDVVPAGDESLWLHPPFAAQIDTGRLYGRGIADMKGGVAAFASAVAELASAGKLKGRVSLLLSTDEEESVVNTTEKALQILSGRGEKFDFALVGEPSNPKELGEEIKIGRRGDVILRITCFGMRGHTAYPHLADNPVHRLVRLLSVLISDKLDEGNAYFGASTLQVTTFDVGNPASNVVPDTAFAQVDVRFNSKQTSRKIIERVTKHIAETGGNFELQSEVVGESFLSPVTKDVELLKKVVTEVCGREPVYSTSGGTSDARFVRKYCPVVEFGLSNATIHKINENETTANIELLKKVYGKFIEEFF